ncbi:hypothetical protein PR048_025542 [Dryococelus australis]|uniref:Uncharacterized protein n=1 Tax=Dryococelus australis TaxID=614101 RepID=A0ABQ9GRM1_9NEOP|nr:hypothetical protein PR048_025542 [Dryococelus australis]
MSMPSISAFKIKYQAKRQRISPSILHDAVRANIEYWCASHSSPKHQSTMILQRYQAFSEKDDEQYHRSYDFKRKI